jgi:DNA-binding transcriptional regulator LsrR (DeoR family)
MAAPEDKQTDPVLSELVAIKQLLVVGLLRAGMQQSQIAAAMGISDATLSRTFPKGLLKSLRSGRDAANG